MFGDLVLADHCADRPADLGGAAQRVALGAHARGDAGEVALGRRQQSLALARALLRQQRIAADDQPLAGKLLGGRDLRQIPLVEQRQLQRAVIARQLLNGVAAQARDPIKPGRLHLFANARAGQHSAVADQHHPLEREPLPQLLDLGGERRRVGRIAVEHLDRHRQSLARAEQAVDDLQPVRPMVAAVAVLRQRAFAALQIGRADVVEHQRAVLQMPPRQRALDPRLLLEQPVERRVDLALRHRAERQNLAQAAARRLAVDGAHEPQLRARRQQSVDDQSDRQIAETSRGLVLRRAEQQSVELDLAQHAQPRRDVAVRQRPLDPEPLLARRARGGGDRHPAFQQPLQPGDQGGRKFAQIGQRALLRLARFVAIALAQQDRRRRRPIRHGLDEHARIESQPESRRKSFTWTQTKIFFV